VHVPFPPLRRRGTDRRPPRWSVLLALVLLAVAVVLALPWLGLPPLTERDVRQAVYATLQRESAESFLVTGTLELTATSTVRDTRRVLGLSLGTSTATVRVPGRVSYGVDVEALRPEMIKLRDDGIVHVTLPELAVYAVEPRLAELEVETERGWARAPGAVEEPRDDALRYAEGALRSQARQHLHDSIQPRVNTARALQAVLAPVLTALGMEEPRFFFELGRGIIVRPTG